RQASDFWSGAGWPFCGTVSEGSRGVRRGPIAENRTEDEADIGRPFSQPTHEVRKPIAAERHVNPDAIPGGHERGLQIAPDAVEHLKLETGRRDLVFLRQVAGQPDHRRVV